MTPPAPAGRPADRIPESLIATVSRRLAEGKAVRRTLPGRGRVHIDRQLPFLCVYRRPPSGSDGGTERLVTSEASYLIAPGGRRHEDDLRRLVRSIVETLGGGFGAFLLLEVWSARDPAPAPTEDHDPSVPRFRLFLPPGSDLGAASTSFGANLERIRLAGREPRLQIVRSGRWSPRRQPPLLSADEARALGCRVAGLEVEPIYRDAQSGEVFPLLLRKLVRSLTRALRRTFYDFVRSCTTHLPEHYHVLGRRAIVAAVWEADRRLAEVSDAFDLLLQTTPVNSAQAWREFERSRFERRPVFRYRPLRVDPVLLKRRLYAAPVEKIEDPALFEIFREKQDELDRRITMLLDIDTRRFLHGSLQLHGGVGADLLRSAESILASVPPRARERGSGADVDAAGFARLARAEMERYRKQWSGLRAKVEVREDLLSGLLVSQGSLLVGSRTRIPEVRVDALLQHEVGTHVLTYYNGRATGFRQLYSGLAGYEALQEGIAVLAEYLVGGLSRARLRLLAGRVVAVRALIDGAGFVETFRALRTDHGFSAGSAFSIATRVYRGGGLTKDAIYLRGLGQVLEYLGEGGILDRLFVGKIAVKHVPVIRELRLRGVLDDPPLRPVYIDREDARRRLGRLRSGATFHDLLAERRSGPPDSRATP